MTQDHTAHAPSRDGLAIAARIVLPIGLLMAVIGLGISVRFDGITRQGISRGTDNFLYLNEAKAWLDGTPQFMPRTPGGSGSFYRPAAHLLDSWALRIGGYNDYSIKTLRASMDVLTMLLIVVAAGLLTRSLWPALASVLLYAFLPNVVQYARAEMVHSLSTTFVTIAFLLFILFHKFARGRLKLSPAPELFLFASGFFLGSAANTHGDLAFLAPGFVLFIFLAWMPTENRRAYIRVSILRASIYSFGFFTPYFIGLVLFGPMRVIDIFATEIPETPSQTAERRQDPRSVFLSRPRVIFQFFSTGLAHTFGKATWFGLALAVVPLALATGGWRRWRAEADRYLPAFPILTYVLGMALVVSASPRVFGRLYLPLIPLTIMLICVVSYHLLRRLGPKPGAILYGALFVSLFYMSPKTLPGQVKFRTPYREVYDALEGKVDSNNRLLVAPVLAYSNDSLPKTRGGFTSPLYFGRNGSVLYFYQIPFRPEWNYNELTLHETLKDLKIRYIFVSKWVDRRLRKNPRYATWIHNDNFEYSVEKDKQILQRYIELRGGNRLLNGRWGQIYELPPASGEDAVRKIEAFLAENSPSELEKWREGTKPQLPPRASDEGMELIGNGSFEDWKASSIVPEGCKLVSGSVERTFESSHGDLALRINAAPRSKRGSRVQIGLKTFSPTDGSKFLVEIDAFCSDRNQLGFALYAPVDGKVVALTREKNKRSDWVNHRKPGRWITFRREIELPEDMDRSRIYLILMLRPAALRPAIVDNVSVRLVK